MTEEKQESPNEIVPFEEFETRAQQLDPHKALSSPPYDTDIAEQVKEILSQEKVEKPTITKEILSQEKVEKPTTTKETKKSNLTPQPSHSPLALS